MKKIMRHPFQTPNRKTDPRSSCQLQVNLPKGNNANPLRILEPTGKQLTSLKAERVFRVLQESIRNIQIILILPEVVKSLERFNIVFGQELYAMLQEHSHLMQYYDDNLKFLEEGKELEREYNEWLANKNKQMSFSESSSETESESDEQQHDDLAARVQEQSIEKLRRNVVVAANELNYSTRNILRKLRTDPTARKVMLEQAADLSGVKGYFVVALQDLQSIVREKLLTTPTELEERKYYIGKVVQRENKVLKIKQRLELVYEDEIRIKIEEEKKQTSLIDKLKESLRSLSESSNQECSKMLTDANQKIKSEIKDSDAKQRAMIQESIDAKKILHERLKQNFEEEREKRKKKFKLSTEVFNWIQKYDTDMGTRQDEYDEVLIERERLTADLNDLQNHFDVMEKEYLDILEERRLAEEEEEKQRLQLENETIAAIKLQSYWRGYRARKQLKKKMREKKKKGKKGKKK